MTAPTMGAFLLYDSTTMGLLQGMTAPTMGAFILNDSPHKGAFTRYDSPRNGAFILNDSPRNGASNSQQPAPNPLNIKVIKTLISKRFYQCDFISWIISPTP